MDVHVHGAVTRGLRLRGVDVLTAQEDGQGQLPDADLLDRSTALGRVLVTYDEHLLIEATRRQSAGIGFAGLLYHRTSAVRVGPVIRDLEFLCQVLEPTDMWQQVRFLPF
jgi:hypothetical protein